MGLSAEARRRSATVRGTGFPISDKAHARSALARLNQAKPPLSAAERARVVARARAMLRR